MGRLLRRLFGEDADVLEHRNFQLLLLASVSSPLGESVLSPVLDSLTDPYGVSGTEIGLLMSAFTAPAIVAIPLVGVVSDRYGRKPVLTAGLLLFGLAGLAMPLTTDFRTVLVLRLLQGVGYTGIAPVLITSVGDLYEGAAEATAQGLRFTTVAVSLSVFPLLAGLLVAVSWRAPLVLFGVAIPSALVVWFYFEEPSDVGRSDSSGSARELLRFVRHPGVAALLVGRAVPSFLWFTFLTYNSIFVVRVLGGTPSQAGALVAATSVASGVGSTQVGRLTAAFESRATLLLVSAVVGCAGLGVVAAAPALPVAAVGAVVFGGSFSVLVSLYRSAVSTVAPERLRGGLVSVGESVGRVGGTLAPVLTGALVGALAATAGFDVALRTALLVATAALAVLGAGSAVVAGRSDVFARATADS